MNGRYERTAFGVLIDGAGMRLALIVLSILFFVLFWGARPASASAGLALSALALLMMKRGEKRRRAAREARLRRTIGGACAMERLLLLDAASANDEVASLLAKAYGFTIERVVSGGVLCEIRGERVLVGFLQKHQSGKVGAEDVLGFQRAAHGAKAIRGVLALSAEAEERARAQAENAPRVTLYTKKRLQALLGARHPATDVQLKRAFQLKRQAGRGRLTIKRLFSRERAPRCALYGTFLLLLYVLTGLPYYPIPGAALVLLAAISRCARQAPEEI